ncbi:ATP-binding protein [Desulfobaculum bizertense]|uniref:sensor histidine kinase n=1 Tax=Desulfobaculum bizertense TaxID=376490 RepID=UPI001F3B1D06|nr:ATP-binding protein [Desulfobaculum bizertense]UIJ37603.1 ATP-binding protein [Desulfobaculum bizertense]
MSGFSFRTRLQFSFFIVVFISLLLPALYAKMIFQGDVLKGAEMSAERELRLARQLVLAHGNFASEAEMQRWLNTLGAQLDVRMTYVSRGGRVIADSAVTPEELGDLENHAMRPEFLQAEKDQYGLSVRYSSTLERKLIYAATRIDGVQGVPEGMLRLAIPFADVQDRLTRLQKNALVVLAIALVLAFVLSLVLSRYLARSMTGMIDVAKAIGDGDYQKRLRVFPGREFRELGTSINQMAESIEKHVETIRSQSHEFEAILNGMHEGVMVLNKEGRISTVNPALARIFPKTENFVDLRPLEIVLSPELQQTCDRALDSRVPENFFSLQIEPERGRIYDVAVVRLQSENMELGAIVVFHDISELKRLEQVRRDFVANVSHELRTPLTTIRGYSETLVDNNMAMNPQAERFLEIILRNADHMAKMVDDLMSLARLEDGRESFQIQSIDVLNAAREAIRTCEPLAQRAEIDFSLNFPAEGLRAEADFDRIVQVFRNLFENAIRYSPIGECIEVSGASCGDGFLMLSVQDFGPGVPQEDRERVFERFYRVEKHRTKKGTDNGSTGLGLAICRHIVERHGGVIRTTTRLDGKGGARFEFTLREARPEMHHETTQS